MVKDRSSPQDSPLWNQRLVEWALVAAVIVVLALVFFRQVRVMQGQAELATIKSTLGALRTVLVIEHLHKNVALANSSATLAQRNPFELLQRHPVNYLGEMTPAQAEVAPTGSWMFDPVCVCVGYLPTDTQWFDSPRGNVMAWYQVTGAPGPLQLTAKEAYVWQGQEMN